jgi:hypothetical protein
MILRRLTTAFRKQDWFTVAVETLIVVFGVFIGLQVNNWNTAREGREQERNYLARLHEEVAATLVEQESDRAHTVETASRLREVTAYFDAFGKQEARMLEPVGDHCSAVIASHIYAGDITLPPTISELIATGRILLISNESLRLQIVQFAQAVDEYTQLRHDIQVDRMVLSRKYPDLISMYPSGRQQSRCDFPKMAQSQAFLNDFLDNTARFYAYSAEVMQGQHDLRITLDAALGQELANLRGKDAP